MNLIILTDDDHIGEGRYRLTDHRAEHIRAVLGAAAGDTVQVGLLNGPVGTASVDVSTPDQVILRTEQLTNPPEIIPSIDLICALPRPQTLKKVLLASAMMGVRRLDLIRANRVEKSYFQPPVLQPGHFMPILIEGLSQGKLTRLPQVAVHERFRKFFDEVLPGRECEQGAWDLRLLPDPEAGRSLAEVWHGDHRSVMIAIGPEGGWVPFETDLMRQLGFAPVSLGRWILRVEHAVMAILSQVELMRMAVTR